MTEALTAVLNFGFKRLDLNRIEALVKPDNDASLGLLRKLGFREEGLLRQYGYWHGRYHDLAIYSILKSEWRTINVGLTQSSCFSIE
jgi:ribosomal-protein-alanine N-acetyltransferase